MAFKMGFNPTGWRSGPRRRGRGMASQETGQAKTQEPDFYEQPEHERTQLHEAMSGMRPQAVGEYESIEEQANVDPETWYNMPEPVRRDILKARGFGVSDDSIARLKQREEAIREMLRGQSRR